MDIGASDPGDLVELGIPDDILLNVLSPGFYRGPARFRPEIEEWCRENLTGGATAEVRWTGSTGNGPQAMVPRFRFIVTLTCIEDAALFRLFWL